MKQKSNESILRDAAILGDIKRNSERNYLEIMSEIHSRRRRRVFLAVSGMCAAASLLLFVLIHPHFRGSKEMIDIVDTPTLITDSGEMIPLGSSDSYTLDLTEDIPKRPDTVIAEAEVESEVEAKPDLVAAASIKTSTVVIPQGYTYNILFDDGTEAYVNSGSYIEFPKSFEGRAERRVSLRGEACFKVAKSDRPFIVEASGVEVKVYGTEFNVNTNKAGKVETVLVSGSVGVKETGADEEIMMKPGEKLTYETDSRRMDMETVEPHEYLAWMRGDFTFTDRPLSELLEEIGIFYDIEIDGKDLPENMPVTINLSRKLGHRQIMEILELALGVEFENTGPRSYDCKTNFN